MNGNAGVNGGSVSGGGGAGAKEEKKKKGLSLRKLFGGAGLKAPRERVPRAAMTYGDLA